MARSFAKISNVIQGEAVPDPLARAAVTVAWVILLNKPVYPFYVWYLTGEGVAASLFTLVAVPFYLGVLLLARRSALSARIALVLVGTGDTLFETKLFGTGAGTELFFAACIMLVAVLFAPKEVWWQRSLAATVFVAFVFSRIFIGPPLWVWSDDGLAHLFNLNAFAVASLMTFIALRFAGLASDVDQKQSGHDQAGLRDHNEIGDDMQDSGALPLDQRHPGARGSD